MRVYIECPQCYRPIFDHNEAGMANCVDRARQRGVEECRRVERAAVLLLLRTAMPMLERAPTLYDYLEGLVDVIEAGEHERAGDGKDKT